MPRTDPEMQSAIEKAYASPEWAQMTPSQHLHVVGLAQQGKDINMADIMKNVPRGQEYPAQRPGAMMVQKRLPERWYDEPLFFLKEGAMQAKSAVRKELGSDEQLQEDLDEFMGPTRVGVRAFGAALPGLAQGVARAALPQGDAPEAAAAPDQPADAPPPPPDPTTGAAEMARDMRSMEQAVGMSVMATPQIRARTGRLREIADEMSALEAAGMDANSEPMKRLQKARDTEEGALRYAEEIARERQDVQTARSAVELKHRQRQAESQEALKSLYEAKMAAKQTEIDNWQEEHGQINMNDAIMQKSPLGIIAAVLTGVGSAIGAYAATMAGTENFAARMAERGLQARLQAKKAELAKSAAMGKELKSDYAKLRDVMGDELAADLAFRVRDMNAVLKSMDDQISLMKEGEDKANAQANRQAVLMKREQDQMELNRRMQAQTLQGLQAEGVMANQIMRAKMDEDKVNASMAMAARKAARAGVARGERLTPTVIEKVSNLQAAEKEVLKLKEEFKKVGPEGFIPFWDYVPGTDAKDYRSKAEASAVQLVKSLSGAQVTDKEREYIMGLIPTAGTSAAVAEQKFEELVNFARTKRVTFMQNLQSAGYDAASLFGQNPQMQPTGALQGMGIPTREAY